MVGKYSRKKTKHKRYKKKYRLIKKGGSQGKSLTDIITKACSTYNNLKEIDLDKVKFVEGNLFYKNIVLQKIKFISEGTYGKV